MTSAIGAAHAHVQVSKPAQDRPLNPAQQARSTDPTAKGADFGALVSSLARAKHAPPPPAPSVSPPAPAVTTDASEPGALVNVSA